MFSNIFFYFKQSPKPPLRLIEFLPLYEGKGRSARTHGLKLHNFSLNHSTYLLYQTSNFQFINRSPKMYAKWSFDLCKILHLMV